ncbi:RCC1 domain-containing protein [Micavibrio aeruginosavorus]|uniref:RCC1 domain-containing protein n=1 Tax=Micavibrio aeruginosavorus TaxID=349221 RepID=UPI003F4A8D35
MFPSSAQAACSTPTGAAGDVIWSSASNTPAYCNDTSWVAFPKGVVVSSNAYVSANNAVSCGLRPSGALYCWGLGYTSSPVQQWSDSWGSVSAGGSYVCGLRSGALYCWGSNANGRTGLGTTTGAQATPAQVGVATDWSFVRTGSDFTCGVQGGALYCWGNNSSAKTGLGTSTGSQTTPAQVGADTDWLTVSGDLRHACGIRSGQLYCWGENANGKTGLGTTTGNQMTPAQVGVATDWTAISAGWSHACGIRSGSLYCWGENLNGRTGLGTTTGNQTTPAQVGAATDWDSVSVYQYHSCGIRSGGALYCWGSNGSGRTGFGTTSGNTLTPAQVGADPDWDMVSAGNNHTCGVRGPDVYCWGSNLNGVTGLGVTSGTQSTPALTMPGAAGCLNPAGAVGDVVYNTTSHVLQYCDGDGWYAAGSPGNGGAGCSNPAGVAGDVAYNATHNVLQYCEGDAWVAIGDFVPSWCSGVVVGGYCWYVSALNQSCDAACASRGGVNSTGVINYAGSSGTLANCTAVVQALVPGIPAPSNNGAAQAVGCAIANIGGPSGPNPLLDIPVRYNLTPTTTAASYSTMWRVCACNN